MTVCALHHALDGLAAGTPLLLLGSLGTTLAMWEPQRQALAERRRLIRADHRGHGGSPVPDGPYTIEDLGGDALALLDRLGVRRASYCGLSLGGMVGMWLAAHAPERIDRLVLLCTSAHPPNAGAYLERAAAVRAAGSPRVVADSVVERWFTPALASERPDVVAAHRAMIAATPAEGYAGCCEAIAALDLRDALARIEAPTLVIAGADDPATPPDEGLAIAEAIAGARLEVVADARHLASVQQAGAVNRLIGDHLDSREGS